MVGTTWVPGPEDGEALMKYGVERARPIGRHGFPGRIKRTGQYVRVAFDIPEGTELRTKTLAAIKISPALYQAAVERGVAPSALDESGLLKATSGYA